MTKPQKEAVTKELQFWIDNLVNMDIKTGYFGAPVTGGALKMELISQMKSKIRRIKES